jgi:UDPglucose 6-dehydrogenase
MKIGIIGNGFVGKATFLLKSHDLDIIAYDINQDNCIPKGITLESLKICDVIFISVPTPMSKEGSCHLDIIKSVFKDLKKIHYEGLVVLRSTVPPGTCDSLKCCFMPEFLTEKNYEDDFINNKKWIFGLCNDDNIENNKKILEKLINIAYENNKIKYNTIEFVTTKEAEMIKMFRNVFLATKVSLCNEFAQYCMITNINYENVRRIATEDERIGPHHSKVPGPDEKKGFGGTCFPKDISSMHHDMKKNNMKPYILEAVIVRNNTVDRPTQDWKDNIGRAVV